MDVYKYHVAGDYTESDEAMISAAWTLVSINHSNLDPNTTKKLQEIKRTLSQTIRDESRNPKSQIKINVSEHEDINTRSKSRKLNNLSTSAAVSPGLPPSHPPSTINIEELQLRPPTRPPLPELQHFIGLCSSPFAKQITPSDVRRDLCRLMLKKLSVESYLLPMLSQNENISNGIPVTVYGPDGGSYAMTFIFWSKKFYVLSGTMWNRFCQDYELKSLTGRWATFWMFRHNGTNGLCFVITWKNITPPSSPKLIAEQNDRGNSRKRQVEDI